VSKRRSKPSLTVEDQAAELVQIDAELKSLQAQITERVNRLDELRKGRADVKTRLVRDRLQGAVGDFVKITGSGYWMTPKSRLKPMEGDIGRLLKVGRTRALIDFGEELHTWYVALQAIGTVQDPLTKSLEDLERQDADRRWLAQLEERMDELDSGPPELPDEDEDEDDA
jgi:hypothetical protein